MGQLIKRLDLIQSELREIRGRLDEIEKFLFQTQKIAVPLPESKLLQLSDHLRKSFLALSSKGGESSASDVACITGKKRGSEARILNLLATMGWLTKRRNGKHVVFAIKEQKQPKTDQDAF